MVRTLTNLEDEIVPCVLKAGVLSNISHISCLMYVSCVYGIFCRISLYMNYTLGLCRIPACMQLTDGKELVPFQYARLL